jgi:hypothetical protein
VARSRAHATEPLRHRPAWYLDPEVAGQLRRWTGTAWSEDVRPLPGWAAGLQPAVGPGATVRRSPRSTLVRRLWTASSITLALALVLLLSLITSLRVAPSQAADRVGDDEFLAAAAETCAQANARVLEPYRQAASQDPEGLATAVERFVDDLRAIDVAPADRERVAEWIAAWDAWTEAGHEYADALEDDDQARADRITRESFLARTRVSQFAYANGLGACAL